MTNEKVIPTWLSAVLFLLCLASLALSAMDTAKMFNTEGLLISITQILCSLSVIFALLYSVYGYSKNAAGYFSLLTGSMLLTDFCGTLTNVVSTADAVAVRLLPTAMYMISYACLAVLLIAKDLKKKKSFALVGVIIAAYAVRTACHIASYGLTESYNVILSNLSLALVLGIMIFAKYKDKANRGTT